MDFAELIQRFRDGDEAAAATIVETFGPQIRRAIRIRSTGTRLQRVFDSADLFQSVLRLLWQNRDSPNLPTDNPARLVGWLLTVARNRAGEERRRQRAAKRGGEKLRDVTPAVLNEVPAREPTLSSEVADRELLEKILRLLPPEDRAIAEARAEGAGWKELAQQHGVGAEALRKRHRRAVQEVIDRLTTDP